MTHTWWLPLRRNTVPLSHDTKLCNYVQNGLATMSIFALQLWVLLFYNKQSSLFKAVILSLVESSSEKCVKCSQLKMIGNTVFWGKHLFYTVFLILILSPPKNHTVYLTWIVIGTVFFVWIKGSIPRKIILTKEKYSIYEHSCCNYCNFWRQTPLMFF